MNENGFFVYLIYIAFSFLVIDDDDNNNANNNIVDIGHSFKMDFILSSAKYRQGIFCLQAFFKYFLKNYSKAWDAWEDFSSIASLNNAK